MRSVTRRSGAPVAWRRYPATPGVPEELARFVASEWPGAKCAHEALDMWKEACARWLAEDSTREPRPGGGVWWLAGGTRRALPFGETGGGLDLLREEMAYRAGMPPCPREFRPAQHWVNGPP
jgi:hypothetical protein